MPLRPFKRLRPGGQISASEINRAFSALETQDRVTGGRGLQIRHNAGGKQLHLFDLLVWAKIVCFLGGKYGWNQVQRDPTTGNWLTDAEGLSGDEIKLPAYEVNGNATISAGTIVRMWLGVSQDYFLFSYCCTGTGVTLCGSSSSSSSSSV